MTELWIGLALVLVFEGLLPALSPRLYRKAMLNMVNMDSRALRLAGLISLISGAVWLYLIKH